MPMEKLLIVDDNDDIRKQLKWGLGREYEALMAKDVDEALALFGKHVPKVVTLDLGLPPHADTAVEGLRCLERILAERPPTKIIVITGNEERENALMAVRMGAYDYYRKPIELKELKVIVKRAFHLYDIEEENFRLHAALAEGKPAGLGAMLGQCPEMAGVFSIIRKVASSNVNVLIVGESGTGKELAARAIHAGSLRDKGPFVPINCGAIPENLLESELFGHEKGAFTGAHARLQGKFEYAHGGTLFLDEIGELPASLQVKLLRFLQEKTIQRVGGREDIPVDTRIIAATNIDISRAIKEGDFREDLYYRLGVITVKLPPLRERRGDVMLLANFFLQKSNVEFKKRVRGFSSSSVELLGAYHWPGNVRELENRMQRAVIMSEATVIQPQSLGFMETPVRGESGTAETMTLREGRDRVEKEMIIAAIEKCEGNIARTAERLGVSRPTLYDLMKKHGLFSMPVQGRDGGGQRNGPVSDAPPGARSGLHPLP
jgi:two-component system NtrC family response regulator